MNINTDALLAAAVAGDEGRVNAAHLKDMAKDLAATAVFVSLQLHKLGSNEEVSCASLANDTTVLRYLTEALCSAQVAAAQAHELATALNLKALKDAQR